MVTVTISEKGGQQSQYDFDKSEITIGRMKGNDIVLPKGNVSKKHSRISLDAGNLHIADLNSTNGTYVNGRKVTGEQPITPNDKVYIGDFILQVEAAVAANQPPKSPPQPPQPSQSGFGEAGGGGGAMPPSPPAGQDQVGGGRQPVKSPPANSLGGGGPVDDLFAAGDSQPPSRGSAAQGPDRRASSAGGPTGPGSQQPQSPVGDAPMDFDDFDFGEEPASKEPRPSSAGNPSPRRSSAGNPARGASAAASPSRSSGGNPVPASEPVPSGADAPSAPTPDLDARSAQPAPEPSRSPVEPPAERAGGRLGREMGPGTAYPQGGGVMASSELGSEFDADFHAAQHDVARVLFETLGADELPLDYPPAPADRDEFQRLVTDAVNKVNPRVARNELIELITDECVGLGPVDLYLDDPQVRDIYVNRFDQVLVRRDGKMLIAERAFSHPQLLDAAAQRLLGTRDPMVGADEVRFSDGTRVHVVMPPLSVDGAALTIRKPPTEHPNLDDLVERGALSSGMREFLDRAVQAGRSILVAGPTSSGKSTLLGAIARQIPSGTRMVTIEESTHLDLPQGAVVRLEARPASGFDMRYLVRTAVAMHPQRIIVDECRGAEAYEWVSSAASGTEGSMLAAHGTSASDALGREADAIDLWNRV
ncbi:MAG: ATPase, T2SS/T4P/T4SS family, partial [Persicimonas sp.]